MMKIVLKSCTLTSPMMNNFNVRNLLLYLWNRWNPMLWRWTTKKKKSVSHQKYYVWYCPSIIFTGWLLEIQEVISHDIPIRSSTSKNDIKYEGDRWSVPKNIPMAIQQTISQMLDNYEKASHLMCDELQIKLTLCWNTQIHELVGFVTDSSSLDFVKELKALEWATKYNGQSCKQQSTPKEDDEQIAKK